MPTHIVTHWHHSPRDPSCHPSAQLLSHKSSHCVAVWQRQGSARVSVGLRNSTRGPRSNSDWEDKQEAWRDTWLFPGEKKEQKNKNRFPCNPAHLWSPKGRRSDHIHVTVVVNVCSRHSASPVGGARQGHARAEGHCSVFHKKKPTEKHVANSGNAATGLRPRGCQVGGQEGVSPRVRRKRIQQREPCKPNTPAGIGGRASGGGGVGERKGCAINQKKRVCGLS